MKLLVKELTVELVGPRDCLQGWIIWEPEASNTLLAARNCFSTLHDMWNNVKAVARIAHQVSSSGASLVWAFASWQCWRRSGDQNYTSNCHFCPSEAISKALCRVTGTAQRALARNAFFSSSLCRTRRSGRRQRFNAIQMWLRPKLRPRPREHCPFVAYTSLAT